MFSGFQTQLSRFKAQSLDVLCQLHTMIGRLRKEKWTPNFGQ